MDISSIIDIIIMIIITQHVWKKRANLKLLRYVLKAFVRYLLNIKQLLS